MGKTEIIYKEKNKDIFLLNGDIIKVVDYSKKYPFFTFFFKSDFIDEYPNSKVTDILNNWQ